MLMKTNRVSTRIENIGTAVCTGITNASIGIPTIPAPNPDMPRIVKAVKTMIAASTSSGGPSPAGSAIT
jgi:hypothetical protein